jgi:uncharacterized protein YbjT (DUF2867 family)
VAAPIVVSLSVTVRPFSGSPQKPPGQLGRQIVERLLTRAPAHQVGVSVRDPRKAQALADQGVRVRYGDLADAAAAILADEGRFDGPTPPLTAAQVLTFADIAAMAAEITGRPITRITVSDGQFREQLTAGGVPAEVAGQLLGIFAASRTGEFAATDPTLAALLGREPTTMAAVLRAELSGD